MKLKRLVCIMLAAAIVLGLSPVSIAHVHALDSNGSIVVPEEGLIYDYDEVPEYDQYEELEYDEDDELIEEEDYIDSSQEEQPLDDEIVLMLDELLAPAIDPVFTNVRRVLVAILAAGGIHFADGYNMMAATTVLLDAIDANLLGIVNYYASNLEFEAGTSSRTFETTAESLTPIWEFARSFFTVHGVGNWRGVGIRQVAKIQIPATPLSHFHVGNHIGGSVIPVICLYSIPLDEQFTPQMGGFSVSDPSYINALINILPSSVVVFGNTYTSRVEITEWWSDWQLNVYRNNVFAVNIYSLMRPGVTSFVPIGFAYTSMPAPYWSSYEFSWELMKAYLHTDQRGVSRLIFGYLDSTHNHFWGTAYHPRNPFPNFFPMGVSAIIGQMALENIVSNMSLAQVAFLDAAGFVTVSDSVRIRVPDSGVDLLGARVTDIVISSDAAISPSYVVVRILAAVLAAGGIYFDNIAYMEAAVIRLYRTLSADYRNLMSYKANSIVYVDDVRATKWESINLHSILGQARNLFQNHVTDDELRIELVRTTVINRPHHFLLGEYVGDSRIPVICLDSIPSYHEYSSQGIPVSVPSYVNNLVSLFPETVTISGDVFTLSVGLEPFNEQAVHVYRNGVRVRGPHRGSIPNDPNLSLVPVGFMLTPNRNNTALYLNRAHLFIDSIGGVQLFVEYVSHWPDDFRINLPTNNFIPVSTADIAIGHLATPNIMSCEKDTWLAVRDTANIIVDSDFKLYLWFPSSSRDLLRATVTDVVLPYTGDITRRTGIVRYASPIDSSRDFGAIFVYDDAYFFMCAYEYNPSLATMSLLLQLSAWGSNDVADYSEKMINARNLFEDLDFVGFAHNYTDFINNGIVGQPTKDSIGVVAAHRVIGQEDPETGYISEYTLVALAIRGGGYGSEWASNFTIGRNGYHSGFHQSRMIAARFLYDYIVSEGISGEIKIWLTGFSRAGAVANLLAGGINAGHIELPLQVNLESHNFFTYTFATPAGALRSYAVRFGNIFNIIHMSDPVPHVAPLYWDFERYGEDWSLPSRETVDPATYSHLHSQMLRHFNALESVSVNSASYLLDDFAMKRINVDILAILPGGNPFISIQEDVNNPQSQHWFLFDYVDLLVRDFIRTRDNFVDTYQEALRTAAGLIFSTTPYQLDIFMESLMGNFTNLGSMSVLIMETLTFGFPGMSRALHDFIDEALIAADIPYTSVQVDAAVFAIGTLLGDVMLSYPNRATTLVMNLDSIAQAHYPEIYLAWLMSMDPNFQSGGTMEHFTTGHFRIIRINCPVDVRVYLNNELVAAITDDVPQNVSSIVTAVNEDGEKLVFLPATGEYNIVLTATDDSAMSFSVHEFNPHAGAINRIVNYFDIPITTGQRFDGFIGAFSAADLGDTTIAPSSTVYILETGGVTILPCEVLNGNQAKNAFYDVKAASADSSQGIVLGSGSRLRGTYAIVTAIPFDGYEFVGWYLDNNMLVSDSVEYRFRVMGDTNLTARFIILDEGPTPTPPPQGEPVHTGTIGAGATTAPWHLYPDGTLVVFGGTINWAGGNSPWLRYADYIKQVVFTEPIYAGPQMRGLFRGLENAETITGLEYINLTDVTNMTALFLGTSSLTSIGDLSGWDTSNVTHMDFLFSGANNLQYVDLSRWDTGNVITMDRMFLNASTLEFLDLSDWDTRNVTDMSQMFRGTSNLTSVGDLSSWDTGNLVNVFSMFNGTSSLEHLDMSGWDTSNITSLSNMFRESDISTLVGISGWDISNVTDMSGMFLGARSIAHLDLSNWNTGNVITMAFMFSDTSNLASVGDLSRWDTRSVTNMERLFRNASSLQSLNLADWDMTQVGNTFQMFSGVANLRVLTLGIHFRSNVHGSSALPVIPNNGRWQNVGAGTIDAPQGVHMLTSAELMDRYSGSGTATEDTWVAN